VYFYQLGLRLQLPTILEEGVRLGFREKTGIDLSPEISPIYPASRAYFDDRYGPRGWTAGATTLNFAIGQGENTQTVVGMTRFYQGLANGGVEVTPFLVRPSRTDQREFGLTEAQALDIRRALIAVVQGGTGARSRQAEFILAGKTGTAQNAHGKDHGWFLGFAPADKPEIVIGMVMEFAEHGSLVGPYVSQMARFFLLGPDTTRKVTIPLITTEDSAPRPLELPPDTTPVPPVIGPLRLEGVMRR
jgi:penicillin-binding protein 2